MAEMEIKCENKPLQGITMAAELKFIPLTG